MDQFKNKKFNDLKNTWYKKLQNSGFKDIEQDDNNLKEWDSLNFRARYDRHRFSSKEAYYQLVGQFLHTHQFTTKRDKLIWERHAEGMTVRQIAKKLKSLKCAGKSKDAVSRLIRKLSKVMLETNNDNN